MKKIFTFIFELFLFTSSIVKPIEFRQATCEDIDGICSLYEKFTADDYQKLVVFPPQIRRSKISEAISHGKIFVACNGNNIVGFVKLFPIENGHEKQSILHDELSLNQIPLFNASSILTEEIVGNYSQPLAFCGPSMNKSDRLSLVNCTNDCLHIYYGGAYTIPEYRNSCINSQLIRFALGHVIQSGCLQTHFKYIVMVYGQVEANQHKQGMIRIFTHKIMQSCNLRNMRIFYLVCKACKPNFVFDQFTQEISINGFEEGFGNMIVYKLS